MIIVITGKNGSGKTLLAVELLQNFDTSREDNEPRKIFTNIRDCIYGEPWDDPDWRKTPNGTIFVYDEAQKVFPQRASSKPVPEILKDLDTHRHQGYDIIFITQYPTHLDHHIRQLCNKHYHVIRRSGLSQNVLYENDEIFDPTDRKSMSGVHKSIKRFDKKLFDKYKSSFEHNYKRQIPNSTKFKLAGFVIAILFATYQGYSFFQKRMNPEKVNIEQVQKQIQKDRVRTNIPNYHPEDRIQITSLADYHNRIKTLNDSFSLDGYFKGVKLQKEEKKLTYREDYITDLKIRMSKLRTELEISSCISHNTACSCYSNGSQVIFPREFLCLQFVRYGDYYIPKQKKPQKKRKTLLAGF